MGRAALLPKALAMCLPARPSLPSRAADLLGVSLSLACILHCLALPLLLLAAPALSAWGFHCRKAFTP